MHCCVIIVYLLPQFIPSKNYMKHLVLLFIDKHAPLQECYIYTYIS